MSWAPRRGAVHSRESCDGGLATTRIGLAMRCRVCWVLQVGRLQVVEQKDVPRADWGRNLAQGVGFLFNHEPLEVPRPSSLMERVKLFEKSSFPGIETVDATSDGQVAVPALSRAKRCAGWGCIGDEVMRGKMVGRGIAADIYDACLGVSANHLSPSKSCQICCSFPRGSRIMACRRSA